MESLSRRPGVTARVQVHEYLDGDVLRHEDRLATEEPLEVRLSWPGHPAERVGVTMRTPGHDFELAAGMLHGEGVLEPSWLRGVSYCTDSSLSPEQEFNVVTVELDRPPPRRPATRYDGPAAAASACGVCGTQSIDEVLALSDVRRPADHPAVSPSTLLALPARLREEQQVFARTGGLHAAGLFDAEGNPLVVREDIGRHNAVDKAVGARLLAGQPVAVPVLGVSGRIGFEIVQKAAAAGIGVLAAIGAPSSLAVRLAEDADVCLVGFLSADRFVAYSAPSRIGVG
ncbi:MAG TPA: formate dehydrogenase accessory sulfurtransferase FdhD [Nocardioidaceae bacterium]|nr:formate dehydrogenase accessory sulfurtransferase FdhD [Nocardioidaceae bacterium]